MLLFRSGRMRQLSGSRSCERSQASDRQTALELPQTMATVLSLRRRPRPPQLPRSGLPSIGAPARRSGKAGLKGKGRGRQQEAGQYAKHLEWPMRPPQAPPHHTSPRGPSRYATHTNAWWPANDTHPAALEMHAFTYDTRRWRGLELKFLKQWGADMIIPGRFRGAFAAIACLNSKSLRPSAKLWRDSKACGLWRTCHSSAAY